MHADCQTTFMRRKDVSEPQIKRDGVSAIPFLKNLLRALSRRLRAANKVRRFCNLLFKKSAGLVERHVFFCGSLAQKKQAFAWRPQTFNITKTQTHAAHTHSATFAMPSQKRKAPAVIMTTSDKRVRAASSSHQGACAAAFPCERAVPLRMFRFDPTASGPAGQQASLERQGWTGTTREVVALVCDFDDCGAFVMEFVAASAALGAATYQKRLCEHQFAANRACGSNGSKWLRHRGTGKTATNKSRTSRCAHMPVQVPPHANALVVAAAHVAAAAQAESTPREQQQLPLPGLASAAGRQVADVPRPLQQPQLPPTRPRVTVQPAAAFDWASYVRHYGEFDVSDDAMSARMHAANQRRNASF